jgi:hypothetical protein
VEEWYFKLITNAIDSGKCLPFLGAGASTTYEIAGELKPGLPAGGELAKWLAEQCNYTNGTSYDLLKVAEYFVITNSGDRVPLQRALQEKINIGCLPRPIHTVLAQLKQIKFIITSNYDDLMDKELSSCGRNVLKHYYNPLNPKTGHFEPIDLKEGDVALHKMHGSIDDPGSMVVTQSDYIQYLANLTDIDRGMPEYLRKYIIPQYILLFLGYGLEDWNFRVIWEGVLANYAARNVRKVAYALVRNPSPLQTNYWSQRGIQIINQDLTEFAVLLAEHYNLEIPQLRIEKKEAAQP